MGAFPFPISHFGSSGIVDPGTLKTGLVALWEFDDTSGSLVDEHNSNDLDDYGGLTYSATGKIDDAITFNGSTGYFRETTSSNLYTPSSAASYSCWFKRVDDTTYTTHSLLNKYYSNTGNRVLIMTIVKSDHATVPNRFRFATYDTSNVLNAVDYNGGGSDIWSGNWTHAVCVRDGDENELFINGVSQGTNTAGNGSGRQSTTSYAWFSIGCLAKSTTIPDSFFPGEIDQSGVWSKALTQGEIDYLYNEGNGNAYANWS